MDIPRGTGSTAGLEDQANVPTNSRVPLTLVAECHFVCSCCGDSAGVIRLFGDEITAEIVRTCFTEPVEVATVPEPFGDDLTARSLLEQDKKPGLARAFSRQPGYSDLCCVPVPSAGTLSPQARAPSPTRGSERR